MKNKEIQPLRTALDEVDYIRGKSFAYAVFKNKSLLDKEIEIINSLRKEPHPDYINFENERSLLCQINCEKDENNNPVLQYNPDGSQAYKIQNVEEFNKDYIQLSDKYKDVLEDMRTSKADFDAFLEKESDVELKKIKMEDLPNDISANFLEKIKYIIE